MKKQTKVNGPSEFIGFIPDVIDKLSERLHFQYQFYEVPDRHYGSMDGSGKWNGMIGECLQNEVLVYIFSLKSRDIFIYIFLIRILNIYF